MEKRKVGTTDWINWTTSELRTYRYWKSLTDIELHLQHYSISKYSWVTDSRVQILLSVQQLLIQRQNNLWHDFKISLPMTPAKLCRFSLYNHKIHCASNSIIAKMLNKTIAGRVESPSLPLSHLCLSFFHCFLPPPPAIHPSISAA